MRRNIKIIKNLISTLLTRFLRQEGEIITPIPPDYATLFLFCRVLKIGGFNLVLWREITISHHFNFIVTFSAIFDLNLLISLVIILLLSSKCCSIRISIVFAWSTWLTSTCIHSSYHSQSRFQIFTAIWTTSINLSIQTNNDTLVERPSDDIRIWNWKNVEKKKKDHSASFLRYIFPVLVNCWFFLLFTCADSWSSSYTWNNKSILRACSRRWHCIQ